MKRLLYVFIMLVVFSACENDYDYTFEKTPSERKAEAKAELTNLLKSSEFGWKTTLVFQGEKASAGDFFVMKFEPNGENNNGEVTVANGFNSEVSEFEVRHEAGTILCFNTYNDVFHWLTKANFWEGRGFGADQEYIFMHEEDGKLIFQGKELENEMVLEKATEQDWDMTGIQEMYDNFMQVFEKNFVAFTITKGLGATKEKPTYVRFNNEGVGITISAVPEKEGWFYEMSWEENGEKVYGKEGTYVFTQDELIFSYPVVIDGDTLDRVVYNKESGIWEIANEGVEGFIEVSDLPLYPSPGAYDNFVNVFVQDGWDIDPWNFGDEGKMEEFADGIYKDCEMFNWFSVEGNYTNPAGENLGRGFVLEGAGEHYGKYAFIPVKFEQLGESEMKFVLDGDIISDIEGAEDVIATDPNIQGMVNSLCNPVGWSMFCSSYFYTPDWEIYPYEFYNMEDPTIIIKAYWSKYY